MSKNPDFTKIAFENPKAKMSLKDWQKDIEQKTGKKFDDLIVETMEQIPVKPLYTAADTENLEHIGFTAGIAPNLRGPYATMYVIRPWTVRNTRVSPLRRNQTLSTAAIWLPDKRAFP